MSYSSLVADDRKNGTFAAALRTHPSVSGSVILFSDNCDKFRKQRRVLVEAHQLDAPGSMSFIS